MFAALRGRGASAEGSTRRRFAETDDASASSSGAILDSDEQENVVASLERQARNAARVWRFAFGVAASLFSLFFARLARIATTHDRAETRDVAWSKPVHIHAYHENASLQTIKTLDVATAASLLAAAAAMTLFEHKRHGDKMVTAKRLTYASAFMLGAFAARGWWRAFREAAQAEGGVVFSDPRVAWVLAVASLGAPACFAIDRSLERTVREARDLRRHMYRHKRA
jgi:hypothetical protein